MLIVKFKQFVKRIQTPFWVYFHFVYIIPDYIYTENCWYRKGLFNKYIFYWLKIDVKMSFLFFSRWMYLNMNI